MELAKIEVKIHSHVLFIYLAIVFFFLLLLSTHDSLHIARVQIHFCGFFYGLIPIPPLRLSAAEVSYYC